jgi:hypothetical protein
MKRSFKAKLGLRALELARLFYNTMLQEDKKNKGYAYIDDNNSIMIYATNDFECREKLKKLLNEI